MLMAQAEDPDIEHLSVDECWSLLGGDGIGHLATATVDVVTGAVKPDIFPIDYLVHNGAILFRSAPGSKLIDLAKQPAIAFQAGRRERRVYWSVVVHGTAERMGLDREIEESGIRELHITHPTEKWNYVRIEVDDITGIRFRGN
jgi:nitroimidazol reductase NimA-like FMN-containing flavoprotein (pyridoxamine 5'-phosphate oxidase superfamily)